MSSAQVNVQRSQVARTEKNWQEEKAMGSGHFTRPTETTISTIEECHAGKGKQLEYAKRSLAEVDMGIDMACQLLAGLDDDKSEDSDWEDV